MGKKTNNGRQPVPYSRNRKNRPGKEIGHVCPASKHPVDQEYGICPDCQRLACRAHLYPSIDRPPEELGGGRAHVYHHDAMLTGAAPRVLDLYPKKCQYCVRCAICPSWGKTIKPCGACGLPVCRRHRWSSQGRNQGVYCQQCAPAKAVRMEQSVTVVWRPLDGKAKCGECRTTGAACDRLGLYKRSGQCCGECDHRLVPWLWDIMVPANVEGNGITRVELAEWIVAERV